jgi:hypothetical protein
MEREPFTFASALKQAIDLCWPRSPHSPEKHDSISGGVDSAPVRGAGNPAQESDAPTECEECAHEISAHGKDGCTVDVDEWVEEGRYMKSVRCGCTAWEEDDEGLTPRELEADRLHESREHNSRG